MEKRTLNANDIDNDTILRAVKAKHDAIEVIRQEKDAYINRVIADMQAEMTYTSEEINSAIEEGEKIIINDCADPEKISLKLHIVPFKTAKSAHENAIKCVLDDNTLKYKLREAYDLTLKTYRKAVRDEWNQRHPMLPGKLASGGGGCECGKSHLWVRNKPEEGEKK